MGEGRGEAGADALPSRLCPKEDDGRFILHPRCHSPGHSRHRRVDSRRWAPAPPHTVGAADAVVGVRPLVGVVPRVGVAARVRLAPVLAVVLVAGLAQENKRLVVNGAARDVVDVVLRDPGGRRRRRRRRHVVRLPVRLDGLASADGHRFACGPRRRTGGRWAQAARR